MFEIIKCYVNLRKAKKFIRNNQMTAAFFLNRDLHQRYGAILRKQQLIKKNAWHDRELARKFNQCVKTFGYYATGEEL